MKWLSPDSCLFPWGKENPVVEIIPSRGIVGVLVLLGCSEIVKQKCLQQSPQGSFGCCITSSLAGATGNVMCNCVLLAEASRQPELWRKSFTAAAVHIRTSEDAHWNIRQSFEYTIVGLASFCCLATVISSVIKAVFAICSGSMYAWWIIVVLQQDYSSCLNCLFSERVSPGSIKTDPLSRLIPCTAGTVLLMCVYNCTDTYIHTHILQTSSTLEVDW